MDVVYDYMCCHKQDKCVKKANNEAEYSETCL